MNYSDFQSKTSSEKITLCLLKASKRLMGWSLHSGSIYKLENLDVIVDGIEDSGTPYTEAASIGAMSASNFFYDHATKTLYVHTAGSDNPNGRFIVLRQKLCFSNVPVVLPHDLDDAEEVPFLPLLLSSSQFGVSIDVVEQTSEAVEGSGSVTFVNDQDFWPANYDKWFFENQECLIYSYHRDLEPSEAKLLFKGKVEKRSYSPSQVGFQLKDQFAEIRAPISLGTIGDLGQRTGTDLENARQRLILGNVKGIRPVNLDQVLDGYPITGTVSATYASATITGSGTQFLSELSPDDILILDGVRYTVATVVSDTSATLTNNFDDTGGLSGASVTVIPDKPKRWMNRVWKVAGHTLREPIATIEAGSTITQLVLDSVEDIEVGDLLYVGNLGSGEIVFVDEVIGSKQVRLTTSLPTIPSIGTSVRRPAIQNVRINEIPLIYYRDYTFDADTATMTLRETAEANAGPIKQLSTSMTFSNGSRDVSGSNFKGTIQPGYMVGVVGQVDFFEVSSVESDTALKLRSAATFSSTATGRYKPLIFNPSDDVITLDSLGKTTDGTSGGTLIKTVPSAVKAMLIDAGLGDLVDEESFAAAEEIAYQHIGLALPRKFNETRVPTYREVINLLNRSSFSSLVQNGDFRFALEVLQPSKPLTTRRFSEPDILSLSFVSTSENMIKTAIVTYQPREYDYLTKTDSIRTHQKTSEISNYILKTSREQTFETFLVQSKDALIHANRWAYLLENTFGRVKFTTKLQGIDVEIGDIVEVEHRKLFERFGGNDNRRLMFVESVKKSGSEVEIEATDLSNSFNRVAVINEQSDSFSSADADDKIYGGFITDEYGLIDNDPETSGTNLIW